jgi:hypothetical protein
MVLIVSVCVNILLELLRWLLVSEMEYQSVYPSQKQKEFASLLEKWKYKSTYILKWMMLLSKQLANMWNGNVSEEGTMMPSYDERDSIRVPLPLQEVFDQMNNK